MTVPSRRKRDQEPADDLGIRVLVLSGECEDQLV